MYTENEKKEFSKRMTFLSRELDVPYAVCMALGGDEEKIAILKEFLTTEVGRDLSDLNNSFLFNRFTEHVNIDAATGNIVDRDFSFHYSEEMLNEDFKRQLLATEKVMRGVSGTSAFYNEIEIGSLPKNSAKTVIKYCYEKIMGQLFIVSLKEALDALDDMHAHKLADGIFTFKSTIKHIRSMWVLKALNVTEVVMPYGVTVICPYAFENVGLKKVTFPRTVSHIHAGAFYGNNLTEIKLPENKYLKKIETDAFSKNNISYLELPKCITALDFHAFRKNPLRSVTASKETKLFHKPKNVEVKEG